MKNGLLLMLASIILLFVVFIMVGKKEESPHPTLTEEAVLPDKYLENVAYFEKEVRHDRSLKSLEKAMKAIWKLQQDVDNESFNRLENVIAKLEQLHADITKGDLQTASLNEGLNFALQNLAHAELEVAEMYAETDQMEKANLALKYAQLHIKNAMTYHSPIWDEGEANLVIEQTIVDEIDSLFRIENASIADYVFTIDNVIKEVDQLIVDSH